MARSTVFSNEIGMLSAPVLRYTVQADESKRYYSYMRPMCKLVASYVGVDRLGGAATAT
jgi:hypothetical protein